MTTPDNNFVTSVVESARTTQETLAAAYTNWADTVASLTAGKPELPDAHKAVEQWFDLAHKVLDGQRDLVASILASSNQAAATVTEQTTDLADGAVPTATAATKQARRPKS